MMLLVPKQRNPPNNSYAYIHSIKLGFNDIFSLVIVQMRLDCFEEQKNKD